MVRVLQLVLGIMFEVKVKVKVRPKLNLWVYRPTRGDMGLGLEFCVCLRLQDNCRFGHPPKKYPYPYVCLNECTVVLPRDSLIPLGVLCSISD